MDLFDRYKFMDLAMIVLLIVAIFFRSSDYNQALFLTMNDFFHSIGTQGMWAVFTNMGDGAFALALATILFVKNPERMRTVVFSAVFSLIVVQLMKSGFSISRPPAVLPHDTFHIIGRAYRGGSFPSGHTQTALLVAGILWHYYHGTFARIVIVSVALLTALSRIAVGVHWPMDVVAGAALGVLCAHISLWVCEKTENNRYFGNLHNRYRYTLISVCLGAIFAVSLFFKKTGMEVYPEVMFLQYLLAILAFGETLKTFWRNRLTCSSTI